MKHVLSGSFNIGLKFLFLASMLLVPAMAAAATWDLPVTPAGDAVFWEYYDHQGKPGSQTVSDLPQLNACWLSSPYNQYTTLLHFELGALSIPVSAIETVTLNFNLISRFGGQVGQNIVKLYDDSDLVLNYLGQYFNKGWNSLDVTQSVLTYLNNGSVADFRFECFVKDSGISFYSAEAGYPSFLRITTKSTNAVPLPAGIWLMGSGLFGLLGLRMKLIN